MDRIAADITSSIIHKLSSHKKWYTTKELLAAGLPIFGAEKIRLELEQNLLRNLQPASTIWADLESSTSKQAWNHYLNIIREEVILPANHAPEIIKATVFDCLKLAVQPRQAIPELIFGQEKELDTLVYQKRSNAIVVNGHLAAALGRYLQKKEKPNITVDKAREVIGKIDEKWVDGYNPLNWKELLEPLFALTGGNASSELVAKFFEDKGMSETAETFKNIRREITDTEFIEIISSAGVYGINEGREKISDSTIPEQKETTSGDEHRVTRPKIASGSIQTEAKDTFTEEITEPETETTEVTSGGIPDQESEPEKKDDGDGNQDEKEIGLNDLFSRQEEAEEIEVYRGDESEEEFDISFDFTLDDEKDVEAAEIPDKELKKEKTPDEPESIEMEGGEDFTGEVIDEEPETGLWAEEEKMIDPANEVKNEIEEEDETLVSRFVLDDPTVNDSLSETLKGKKLRTIYDELNLVKEERKPGTIKSLFDDLEELDSETPVSGESGVEDSIWKNPEPEKDTDKSIESNKEKMANISDEKTGEMNSADPETDVPMWKSFLDRGDVVNDDTPFAIDDSEDDEDLLDEDGFIETPIYDFTEDDEPNKESFGNVSNWLSDERERFIDDIFGGSETAYDIALAEIINYDNWKQASKFLEHEIFSRNRIDLYSEVAVDFTDRLHTYFLEYKS